MSATTTTLHITCPGGDKKDSPRTASRIVELFYEHFVKLKVHGHWNVDLFKKTGGGVQQRIVFKRLINEQINGGKKSLMYLARPFDRDSSWLVIAESSDFDLNSVVALEQGKKEGPAPIVEAEEASKPAIENISVNQLYRAKVLRHTDYGLDIEVGEEKVPGFIPLADICQDGKYDKKAMNKFPVNKSVKVVVSAVAKNIVTCSTRVDSVLTTEDSRDMFSGIPLADGSLTLSGFVRDHKRVYLLIEWMATFGETEPYSKEAAVKIVDEFLKATYPGTTSVDRKAILSLLNILCTPVGNFPEPMLTKDDSGFSLSQFSWSELGGKEKFLNSSQSAPAAIQAVPEPTNPEPISEPLPDEEIVIPLTPSIEPAEEPEEIPLADVVGYAAKALRSAQIAEEINGIKRHLDGLAREKKDLDDWLVTNDKLKHQFANLRTLLS